MKKILTFWKDRDTGFVFPVGCDARYADKTPVFWHPGMTCGDYVKITKREFIEILKSKDYADEEIRYLCGEE